MAKREMRGFQISNKESMGNTLIYLFKNQLVDALVVLLNISQSKSQNLTRD